jgi:hypothetical protein
VLSETGGNKNVRTLTDADVKAIAVEIAKNLDMGQVADQLERNFSDRVIRGTGVGVLKILKRLLLWAIIGLFGYAVLHGFRG